MGSKTPPLALQCQSSVFTNKTFQQVCVQRLASNYGTSVNVTLLAFAAERRAAAPLLLLDARRSPLSIDISSPRGAQRQTRRMGGTDGRTLYRLIDPAPHTVPAVSVDSSAVLRTTKD